MRLLALFIIISAFLGILLIMIKAAEPQEVYSLDKDNIIRVQKVLSQRGYTFEVLSGTMLREGQNTILDLQVRWSDGKNTKFFIELWNEDSLPVYKKSPKELMKP